MLAKIRQLACSRITAWEAVTLAVAAWLLTISCASTGDGRQLDIGKLHAHVEAAALTFSDTSIALAETDPALAQTLSEVARSLGSIDASIERMIEGGADAAGTVEMIDLFLVATVDLLEVTSNDPNDQARARVAIIAARAILAQVRLALDG